MLLYCGLSVCPDIRTRAHHAKIVDQTDIAFGRDTVWRQVACLAEILE